MNPLREFNIELVDKYNNISKSEDLALPLIVSSNQTYIDTLKEYKNILYIGQETNCWVNYHDKDMLANAQLLEDAYLNFLSKRCATNRDFWTFIRSCLDINKEQLSQNIIWSNLFLAGKRTEMGAPNYIDELASISIENLCFLYEYFKPNGIVIVGGPCNPYYKLTIDFLTRLKSNLVNTYPTINNPLLIDDVNNIFWTYHPNYQNKRNMKVKIIEEIRERLK